MMAVALAVCQGSRPPAGSLGEVMRGRRPIEPRLVGSYPWAPCEAAPEPEGRLAAARCSEPPAAGSAEMRSWRRAARPTAAEAADPASVESLHRQALGELLLPSAEDADRRAVEKLRTAAAARPRDARLLNDLGAAYYVRATRRGEPADLLSSYGAVEAAVTSGPTPQEALFNRALILERLHLETEAEQAWESYLAVDRSSDWSREALGRLAVLRRPHRARWLSQAPDLRRAARSGDAATVAAIVAASRQGARELVLEQELGSWGDELVEGHGQAAADSLRIARAIARALSGLGGDGSAAAAIVAIDRAAADPRRLELLRELAEGHRAYRDGSALLRQFAPEPAAKLLARASRLLSGGGSVAALWAAAGLAGSHTYRARYHEADALFLALLGKTDPHAYPALYGRLSWGLGWSQGRQGNLRTAYEGFQVASRWFATAGEPDNVAEMDVRLAEVLSYLGQAKLAWRHRFAALSAIARTADSTRLHYLLQGAAVAAAEDGELAAAMAIATEDVAVAQRCSDPLRLAEALIARSRIDLALDRIATASNDLRAARGACQRGDPAAMKDRIESDLAFAEGETRRRFDPAAALPYLTSSLNFYRRRLLSFNLAPAYLSRARAELALGQERQAEEDLAAAAELVNRQTDAINDRSLRVSFAETAQGLFDEMILFRAGVRGDTGAALEAAEQARSLSIIAGEPAPAVSRQRPSAAAPVPAALTPAAPISTREVPPGVTILEYAVVRDSLLRWTIRREGIDFSRAEVGAQSLQSLIESFLAGLRGGVPDGPARGAAESLFRQLMPPAVRSGSESLVIVPDKSLNQLPFAALRNPESGRYLIEEHALALAPNAHQYLAARRRPESVARERWRALLVADPAFDRGQFPWLPNLPGAAAEIDELGKIYPGAAALTGAEATAARLFEQLGGRQVFHYAGHAVANPADPSLSYLPLAPAGADDTGALFVHQLEGRRFPELRLVVLSACNTITPLARRNGGLSGLARPFLDAGAAAVLGSLWRVEDRVSSLLLVDFHRRFHAGESAAAALRGAQLALLRSREPNLRAVESWAAFELIGDLDGNASN